jgi:hypothetical protein
MKKLTVILLSLLFLAVSSGATVHFHYCMGKLAGIGLVPKPASCGNCGMKSAGKNGCCKQESKQVKVDKFQKSAAFQPVFGLAAVTAILPDFSTYALLPSGSPVKGYFANAPPGHPPYVYLLNRNFRI